MKFKNYEIEWCPICQVAYVACPLCENTTCNGGGCEFCTEEFKEFRGSNYRRSDFPNAQNLEDKEEKFWNGIFGKDDKD